MEGSGEYPTMDMEVTTNATRFTAEQGLLAALQRSKTNKKQNKKKVSMLDNIAQRMQNTQSLNFGGTFALALCIHFLWGNMPAHLINA